MSEYRFSGQKSEEVVTGVFRKSLIAYLIDFVMAAVCLLVFLAIGKYLNFILSYFHAMLIGLILALIIILRTWYLWANTLFLVTSLRIISLNQEGIFKKDIKEAYITEVSQVGATINGLLPSLFNYGNIIIQTYGELVLKDIKDPYVVKEAIYDAAHANKSTAASSDEKFWQVEQQGK